MTAVLTAAWAPAETSRRWVAATATAVMHADRLPTGEGWLPWLAVIGAEGVAEHRGPVQATRLAAQRWAERQAKKG